MEQDYKNEADYETKKILYENSKYLSKAQDERKNTIDNKANILLTIVLVMLGIFIEFAGIDIIIIEKDLNTFQIIARTIITGFYVTSIVLNLDVIIRLVLILKGKNYRTIDPQNFIRQETKNMEPSELLEKFTEEYIDNVKINSKTNEKQMKQHDKSAVLFIISVFFIVATYIGIELVKGGIL